LCLNTGIGQAPFVIRVIFVGESLREWYFLRRLSSESDDAGALLYVVYEIAVENNYERE